MQNVHPMNRNVGQIGELSRKANLSRILAVLNERTVRQAQEDTQCIFTVVSSTTGL